MIDLHSLSFALIFQNALGNRRHHAIVTAFDGLEGFGESRIVVVQLWWPVSVICCREISACRCDFSLPTTAVPATVTPQTRIGLVLPRLHTGIGRCFTQYARILATCFCGLDQALSNLGTEARLR